MEDVMPTHACFDPRELNFTSRGNKELLSVFCKISNIDTMDWFAPTKCFVENRKWQQNFPRK